MTKRDLFRVLLKLFGLYALVSNTFSVLGQLPMFFYQFEFAISLIGFLAVQIALILAFLYLALNPDKVIDMLALDKGFDDDGVVMNLDAQNSMKIGIIIVAGLFFLNNASGAAYAIYSLFKQHIAGGEFSNAFSDNPHFAMQDLTFCAVSMIISWLLISNVNRVSRWLLDRAENPGEKEADKKSTTA